MRCEFSVAQEIQRAFRPTTSRTQHMGINHRRGDILVPKEFLDRPPKCYLCPDPRELPMS